MTNCIHYSIQGERDPHGQYISELVVDEGLFQILNVYQKIRINDRFQFLLGTKNGREPILILEKWHKMNGKEIEMVMIPVTRKLLQRFQIRCWLLKTRHFRQLAKLQENIRPRAVCIHPYLIKRFSNCLWLHHAEWPLSHGCSVTTLLEYFVNCSAAWRFLPPTQ